MIVDIEDKLSERIILSGQNREVILINVNLTLIVQSVWLR